MLTAAKKTVGQKHVHTLQEFQNKITECANHIQSNDKPQRGKLHKITAKLGNNSKCKGQQYFLMFWLTKTLPRTSKLRKI